MHVLLTGATGYIGKRLLQNLLEEGHTITCCVRNTKRFNIPEGFDDKIHIIETDFSKPVDAISHIKPVDTAYFLIHSLKSNTDQFYDDESAVANNFKSLAENLKCRQVIYLGGIANDDQLSKHLSSRKNVESTLKSGSFALTTLRAAIIVGSGSASFEIIRDLVEKLPIMITPKWVNTKCQPIAIKNVINYLMGVLQNEKTYNETFDIGGPDILSYKQMMLDYASIRGLARHIVTVPVMTPRLSSYWLYFITATNYTLAVNLVNSMKVEVICSENRIKDIIDNPLISYKDAVSRAFGRIEQNMVVSSWKDALSSSGQGEDWSKHIQVPINGCYIDKRAFNLNATNKEVQSKIWAIGGDNGWYYATWLWNIRGFFDKIFGGVGLRRGRTNSKNIQAGDALDFWRVLVTDTVNSRLLLYAEMKLPGEAWLEFKIENNVMIQQATFRPKGLTGRLYWYSLVPVHRFIFKGMGNHIVGNKK